MKSNASNFILTVLLAVSLLLSVVFCLQYTFQARELRRLSGQINHIKTHMSKAVIADGPVRIALQPRRIGIFEQFDKGIA